MAWYVRDATALLRSSLPNGRDGLQYLLVGCDIVTDGPERLRGIWVPEHMARALADTLGDTTARRLARFYDCLHRHPVFAVHLRMSEKGSSPPASPTTKARRESHAAWLED